MSANPRQIAFDVLFNWHKSDHTLDRVLEKHANDISTLTDKDRNLCNAIIFGVLRRRATLDWMIQAFSTPSLDKIQIKLLYLLRIAVYQIMYLDRVPDFAAIDTAVELGKRYGGKRSAGFLNAVLRKTAQQHHNVSLPDQTSTPVSYISVSQSMPDWLVERWIKAYGFHQTLDLCEQINQVPLISARTNTLKTTRDGLIGHLSAEASQVSLSEFTLDGIRFSNPAVSIPEMETFRKGWFQIQDEAAQLVSEYLNPKPGEKILDACAGLGTKTCHIGQLMDNQGHLTAADIESYKLQALHKETQRLGVSIVVTKAIDISKTTIKDFGDYFDRVLVDAPCSGLGVLQRNPDSKWKRKPKDIIRLAGRQKKILNSAANLVKPGGVLVYAVCSCETEENENVIHTFLDKRKDYSIDTDGESVRYTGLMTPEGFIKTYPKANSMDGFFAARLRRKQRQT